MPPKTPNFSCQNWVPRCCITMGTRWVGWWVQGGYKLFLSEPLQSWVMLKQQQSCCSPMLSKHLHLTLQPLSSHQLLTGIQLNNTQFSNFLQKSVKSWFTLQNIVKEEKGGSIDIDSTRLEYVQSFLGNTGCKK